MDAEAGLAGMEAQGISCTSLHPAPCKLRMLRLAQMSPAECVVCMSHQDVLCESERVFGAIAERRGLIGRRRLGQPAWTHLLPATCGGLLRAGQLSLGAGCHK